MKRIISLISALMIMFSATSAFAQINDNFLILPSEQNVESFTYYNNAMRVLNRYAGYRYIVEFDVNMPSSNGKQTSYSMDFNHTAMDTGTAGVSHNSVITVTENMWKWVVAGKTVADSLDCGVDYHIKIAVDLKEQKQYCSISRISDQTVIGYLHGEPIQEAISADAEYRISQNLRWGGAWLDKTNETWGPVQPKNVKIIRNSSYVLQQPTITYEEGTISASVMSYHNADVSVDSPILMLCVYDSAGTLVSVCASQETYEENTTSKPVEKELNVSKNINLTEGMTASAVVINSFTSRRPFVPAKTFICSE